MSVCMCWVVAHVSCVCVFGFVSTYHKPHRVRIRHSTIVLSIRHSTIGIGHTMTDSRSYIQSQSTCCMTLC
jgi:hypothetical protein